MSAPGIARPVRCRAVSADGTPIAYDRYGSGPAVVLVHGAFTDSSHPVLCGVAAALSPWFTVVNYDRRGRGGSGDAPAYTVERELDDLAAVIAEAGGPAMVFGGSSGAALALRAAARFPVAKLALWEPPYHVDATAPRLPDDFAGRLEALVRGGRRAEAVERFMVEAAEVPAEAVSGMRGHESWREMEALAHTLAYEAHVMGPGNELPTAMLAGISGPALVLNGAESPGWMRNAGLAVAGALHASHRLLDGQTHAVSAQALAPELLEFFTA
ncbi:alpha/beta fold hydrolase [Nonomuraea sp. NPDC050663]|uniref:alpha/beta fold hydrolase n=1 Tax=Nonomuraea sp. NPDC050663 TaxID=3364370 RepID=UPI00379C7E16